MAVPKGHRVLGGRLEEACEEEGDQHCGDEGSALSPESFKSKEEALEAVQIAEKTLKMCRKLLKEIA